MISWAVAIAAALLALAAHVAVSTDLPLAVQLALLGCGEPETFDEVVFFYASAPRTAMAALVGMGLGVAGSLLQQVTRNRLVSPMTIGASSGAWLALVCGSVVAPAFAASHGMWLSLGGAAAATACVLAIAGRQGVQGLPVVLAGMAMNILLGAIATVVILLHEQYVRNLFIWGAGDLTQTDWSWVRWLAPQIAVAFACAVALRRPLELMKLGGEAARGRGLQVALFSLLAVLVALWLSASAVTAVGVIGFIGLLGPNIARVAGARTARDELLLSAVLGAALLLATDALALYVTTWTRDIVPSGASAALVGVPMLLWLGMRRLRAVDHGSFRPPHRLKELDGATKVSLAIALGALFFVALALAPSSDGWRLGGLSEIAFGLRWPRVVAALAAGIGMAISGVVLQRLLRNPLASPDIMGISAGATLALVGAVLAFGGTIYDAGAPAALIGGLAVLVLLLIIGKRQGHAPAAIALVGISLAAFLDAVLQFVLAKGGEETYMIVGWLAGSTLRVTETEALLLLGTAAVALTVCLHLHRWMTLLSAGDTIAAGRGLSTERSRAILLTLAAGVASAVTAAVGPIAFVGLVAPHLATMLGARRIAQQLLVAAALGAGLMLFSDWMGRVLIYPIQMPTGSVAAILGGGYLLLLLLGRRSTN